MRESDVGLGPYFVLSILHEFGVEREGQKCLCPTGIAEN